MGSEKEFAAHAGAGFEKPVLKEVPPKPFPYFPSEPSLEMKMRNEAMIDLDKWSNNDTFMAKRAAESLILMLADQFSINLVQLEK